MHDFIKLSFCFIYFTFCPQFLLDFTLAIIVCTWFTKFLLLITLTWLLMTTTKNRINLVAHLVFATAPIDCSHSYEMPSFGLWCARFEFGIFQTHFKSDRIHGHFFSLLHLNCYLLRIFSLCLFSRMQIDARILLQSPTSLPMCQSAIESGYRKQNTPPTVFFAWLFCISLLVALLALSGVRLHIQRPRGWMLVAVMKWFWRFCRCMFSHAAQKMRISIYARYVAVRRIWW